MVGGIFSGGWRTHAPILFLRGRPILDIPSGAPWLGQSLIRASAAQAQSTKRSKTLWFQQNEKEWKKKPRHWRERTRDKTHHLSLFSCPPCLCSPPVLSCAGLCFCSPPLSSCKPAWKLLQSAFFCCIVNSDFTTWGSLDPAPRCISQQ